MQVFTISNNPFEAARCTLIAALARMPVPQPIGSCPIPNDFIAIGDHIREAAALFDAWLGAVGHQVSDNASVTLDYRVFDAAFTGAVEGESTWICEQAAAALNSERRVA